LLRHDWWLFGKDSSQYSQKLHDGCSLIDLVSKSTLHSCSLNSHPKPPANVLENDDTPFLLLQRADLVSQPYLLLV
jgi:hypothetical protein